MNTTQSAPNVYTIPDPMGHEEAAEVFFDPAYGGSICISDKVDFSLEQARQVAQRILALVDQNTPASPEAWPALRTMIATINTHKGTTNTLESIAADLGIDLAAASKADVSTISWFIGSVLMA